MDVSPGPLRTGKGRILWVDDEEAQMESIRNRLARAGYSVMLAFYTRRHDIQAELHPG